MQQDKDNNLRNRPKAINYAEEQVKRGGGQMTSYYDYLKNDPASYFYQQLKDSPFLKNQYWTEAANRGELDHLIYLLQSTKSDTFDSTAFDKLKGYEGFMDYDNYMLALELPHLDNETKKPKVINGYDFGEFTDREWAEKVFDEAIGRWDAEILENIKATRSFLRKTAEGWYGRTGALSLKFVSGAIKGVGDVTNIAKGLFDVIVEGSMIDWNKNGEIFLKAMGEDMGWKTLGEWVDAVSFEIQRTYTGKVDAVKAFDQGWRPGEGNLLQRADQGAEATSQYGETIGAGYTGWGKLTNDLVGGLGYMFPAIAVSGGLAGGIAGPGAVGAVSNFGVKAGSKMFYAQMFGGQVSGRVNQLSKAGLTYSDMRAGEVLSNAALKTAVFAGFDILIGQLLGFTSVDRLLGIGQTTGALGKAQGVKLAQAIQAPTGKAAGVVAAGYGFDAAKQGFKGVVRELSSAMIDWAFDKAIRDPNYPKYDHQLTVKNLATTFIMGALTSLIVGIFKDAQANLREEDRAQAVDEEGRLFKLGYFQSINFKNALLVANDWINTVNKMQSKKNITQKDIKDFTNAVIGLQALTNSLGDVYRYLGIDQAEYENSFKELFEAQSKILTQYSQLHNMYNLDSKITASDLAKAKDTLGALSAHKYANQLYQNLLALQGLPIDGSTTLTRAQQKNNDTTKDAVNEASKKLQDANITEFTSVFNVNTKPDDPEVKDIPITKLTEWQQNLDKLGVTTIVGIDGNTVIKSGDVIFVPDDLIKSGNLSDIVTGVAYDVAVDTVLANLNKNQIKLITNTYKEITGQDDGLEKAVMALLFDKNFYAYTLLKSKERGYGEKAFETLTIIDQLIKDQANPRIKNGSLSAKAYLALMKKVQDNMRTGIVTFATNFAKIDLDKISEGILSPELKKQITNHINVKFTEFINDGLDKPIVSAEFVKIRLEELETYLDKYSDSLHIDEAEIIKSKIASGDRDEIRDAYMFLTILSNIVKDVSGQKITYLPTSLHNPDDIMVKLRIIPELEDALGVSIKQFLEGLYEEKELTQTVKDFAEASENEYRLDNSQDRLSIVKDLLYYKSHKTLTISTSGEILKIIPNNKLFKDELLGVDGPLKLQKLAKKGKLRVKDIVKIKVEKSIANTEIVFKSDLPNNHAGGYYDGVILLSTNLMSDPLDTISHEITHRTQDLTEYSPVKVLGGASDKFKKMPVAEKKSLMMYIEDKFDITYELLKSLNYSDNQIIYYMLEGELQAMSFIGPLMLESGFKWTNNKNTLVSPDGKKTWDMGTKYQLLKQKPVKPPESSKKPKPTIPKPPIKTEPVHSEGILTKKLPSTKTLNKSHFKTLVTAKDLISISEKEFIDKYTNVATNDTTQTNPLLKVKVGVNILTSAESDQFLAKAFSLGYEFDNVPNNQKYDFNKWLETGGTGTVYILYNDTKKITITDMRSIDRINFMEDDLKGISLIRYPEGKWDKRELTREVGGELRYIVNPDIIEPHSLIERSLQWTKSAEERLAKSPEIQKDLVSADPIYISKTTKDGRLIPKLLVRGSTKANNVKNKGFSQSTNFRDFDKTESPIGKLSEFYSDSLLVSKDFGEQVNASYATFKKGETAIYNANNRTWQNLKDIFTTKDLAIHKELFDIVKPYHSMLSVAVTKAPADFNRFMEVLKRTRNMTFTLFKQFKQDINTLLQKYPKVSPRRKDGTRDLEFGRESVISCLVTAAQWYSKLKYGQTAKAYETSEIFSIDDIVPVKVLEGYKAIKIDNIIEDVYGSTAKLTNDVIVLRGYDVKRLTGENEADIDVAWKEDLKSMSRYISNETAAKSNLKYWIKKGTPIQIDGRVGNFVVSTTNEFNKLPKVLRDKITTGKLNYYDIIDYVSTANKINNYTFSSIAKHIYGNDELSKLTFNEVQQLIVNITDLAAISKVVDGEELVRTPGQMLMLLQATNMKADKDSKLSDELIKAYKGAQRVKIGNQYVDSTPDPKQLVPVFMRHYKGTLESLRHINNFGKLVAANQQALTLLSGVDTEKYKAQGGVWNWLDRMRQANVDYEKDENLVESLEDIDKFDKIRAIENYVVNQLTIEINKLSAEEREAKAPELLEQYHKATNNLGKLSESELNKQYLATLANELAEDDQRELDPFLTMKDQPRSTKNIKDHLRQSARMVARRINELNQLNDDNDAIKRLSPEVQKVLNDDYILTPAVYGKLTDKQLERLLEEFKSASKQLNTYIRAAKIKKEAEILTQKRIEEMTKKGEKPVSKPKGKTLRDKINVKHTTKIVNQNFTFNSREQITKSAETMLNTQWGKTGTSKVQGITGNKQQNIHNGETFYKENADILLSMTTGEAEATARWFMDANIMDISADSAEAQSFAAIRLYFLGYVFGQAQEGGQFYNFSPNLRNRLQNYLRTQATVAGTSLAVWNNIREVLNPFEIMFNANMEMGGVILSDDEKENLLNAAESSDIGKIMEAQRLILDRINEQKTTSRSIWRKIITVRSMAMLSSPLTWLRYKLSKFMLKPLRNASSKIGEAVFKKKDYAPGQLDMKANITPEIQKFIDEHIISSGLFDQLVSNLSRYNPSSIQARYKNTTRTPSKDTIFANMVIKSMYNQFYNENMFDNPRLNKLHRGLMKIMSDNNYVREATIRYFGKILAEKGHNLELGLTDKIMMDFATAVGIAMKEYMHSNNYFNDIESALAAKSEFGYFMYKLFVPFASTSWNWFKEMMKFTAPGLGRAIYRMATLEEQINRAEEDWQKGKSQVPPELTEYMIRRDLGSGVIGTTMMILGMMLAGLGFIDLEEKDYGIPKLRIGDLRIDIAKIFGSSSLLAGAALVKGWESENFMDALDAMVEPILDSFILTQIIELDKYHSGGLASFGLNFLENTLLSFIPAGVRWLSGATYSGTYKPNNIFQKAVVRIPFLGSVFNTPKRVNPHTGKEGNMWDAFERVIPYLEIRQASTIEDNTKALGLNKTELRGKYEINGEKFNLSAREVAELNKAYGEWNTTMLKLFYSNQLRKSTQMDNGTYRELTYSQMTEDQRRRAVKSIYEKNAEYAKIQAWLKAGNAYYASDNDYMELKRRGVKGLLYKGNKGFVKK